MKRLLAETDGRGLAPGKNYSVQLNRSTRMVGLPPAFCDFYDIEQGDEVVTWVDFDNCAVVVVPADAIEERDSL